MTRKLDSTIVRGDNVIYISPWFMGIN
jgi:hypothetical protein